MTRTYTSPARWRQFFVAVNFFVLLLFISPFSNLLFGQTATFTTSGSWTCPAGVTSVTVQAWGAGGGGGGSSVSNRSGGGGGGGAFSAGVVSSLSGGASYPVIVGAGGAGGLTTPANGGAGTQSAFGGITANGGDGGNLANGGGNGTGGAGGSAGTYKGGNGANGSNNGPGGGGGGGASTLGAGQNTTTGTGGAAGAGGGGGAGGNGSAISGTAGSNGSISGGGGGGGFNSAGGTGSGGQVILNYTCPLYSLTSATIGTNVCSNNSSTISLYSSAGGLPTGNYTVTYNISGATTATGLTASMTVSSAGTGSFTTVALITAGATNITVTNLSSGSPGSCNSTISTNNTASITVYPLPQGSLTANGSFCVSGSGTLTWTATAGTGPFTIVYNDGVANRTVSNVTSGVAFPVFTTPVTSTTTYSLVSVTGQFCQRTSGFTPGSAAITINPLPTITLSAAATAACFGATSTSLSYSATSNSPNTYSISWNASPANSFVPVTDAALPASPITISVPAGTNPGTYTGNLTVKNANGCISTVSTFTVDVIALPADPLNPTSNSPQCSDVGVTLTRNGTPPGGETWFWQTSSNGTSTVNSGSTYNVTSSGTYYLRSRNNTTLCWSSGAGSLAVTVNPLPANPGNPTSNSPQCADVGVTLTRSNPPAGETWFWQTTAAGTSTANSSNTYNVGSSGTYYLRAQNNATLCWSSGAGSLAVTVNPLPGNPGNPTSNSPQCADVGVTLTLNGSPPGGETWFWQTTSGGTSTTNSGNTYNVTSSGTYYNRSRNNTTLCWSSGEGSLAVIVNPLPANPGNPTSNSPQCADVGVTLSQVGSVPGGETWYWQTSSSGTSTANSGSTYNVTSSGIYYLRSRNNTTLCWSSGTGSLAVTVNPLPANPGNPTSNSPQCADVGVTLTRSGSPPGGETWFWQTVSGGTSTANSGNTLNVTSSGTYYIRSRNNTTLCWSNGEGSVAVVVNALPPSPGNPTSNSPQCADVGVTLSQVGSAPGSETWYWQTTSAGTSTGNSGGTYNVTSSGTYYLRSRNNSTLCWSSGTGSLAVVVNALPVATLIATETSGVSNNDNIICAGANVTFTATAGFSNYNFRVNGLSIQNGSLNIFSTTALTNGAAVTVDITNSNNCQNSFGPIAITVNAIPTAIATPASQNVCNGSSISIAFSGTGTTYSWTRDNPETFLGSGIPATTGTGSYVSFSGSGSTAGIFSNIASTPKTVTFNVTPTANGCTGATINPTITVLPVATVNSTANQTFCHNTSTTAINFSGTGTSYTWTNSNTSIGLGASGTGNISSFTASNAGTSPLSGNVTVTPVYTVAGTNCNGTSSGFSITINPIPVLTSSLTANTCSGSIFNYSPTSSATGVTVSYNWSRAVVAGISNAAASGTGNVNETLVNTTGSNINVTYVYTLSGFNNISCANPASYNVVVTVKPTPTVAMTANGALSVCQGVSNNFAGVSLSNPNSLAGTTLTWTSSNTAQITGLAASGTGNISAATLTNTSGSIQYSTLTGTATFNGCSSSTTLTLQVNPPISNNVLIAPIEVDICSLSKQVTFNTSNAQGGDGTYSYLWEYSETGNNDWVVIPGQTGPTLVHTYPQVQAFFRRTALSDGCASNVSSNFQVNKPTTNGITQATVNTTYCSGGNGATISLDASIPSATYTLQYEISNNNWQPAAGFGTITGNGSGISFSNIITAGKYRIFANISGGCSQTYSEVTIVVNNLPNTPVASGTNTICAGASANIVGTLAGFSINWYTTASGGTVLNASPVASGAAYAVTPSVTTKFYAEAVNNSTSCRSIGRDSVTITVRQLPVVNTATQSICSGSVPSLALSASNSPNGFTWQASTNGNVGGLSTNVFTTSTINNNGVALTNNTNTSQTITYTVSANTTGPTCTGPSTTLVTVVVDPRPTVNNKTATICSANAFTVTPTNGVAGDIIPSSPITQYTWSAPSGAGFTGGTSASNASNISGTLTNTTNSATTATYTVTPIAGSCSGTAFTTTVTINPRPFVTTQNVAVCSGNTFTVTPANGGGNIVPASTTYAWPVPTGSNISGIAPGTGLSSISGTITNTSSPAIPVTATYTVTPTGPSGLGSCVGNDFTLVATINPLPTATISGTTAVCLNAASTNITFTGANGTAPYTFTYNINGGANQTANSVGNSINVSVPTGTAGVYNYNLLNVRDASATLCTQVQIGTATITVNPLPTATISGTTAVCLNAASPNITFTGANGTAPYTFTYNINGGANLTATSAGNSITVSVPTGTAGVYNYNLVSVRDASATLCTQVQSGTATITVNPLPTATISGTTAVCLNAASPNITFTGANGTAPYTFTYNINGGANLTATSAGNSITVSVPTGTAGVYNYNLVSVRDASATLCTQVQTGTATITVNPLPTANISGTTVVCLNAASPNITFTGANGTAPYTFTYNINGGANQTANSVGNSITVSVPTGTAGVYNYNLISVIDASSSACSQNQAGTATVTVNTAITATLSGDATICAGGSATLTIAIPAGAGNYFGTINPGGIAFSGTAPAIPVIVSPGATSSYSIASISGTCVNASGTATVTIPNGTPGLWTCAAGNSDWFDCRNWANGMVPDNLTNVTISTPVGCNPVIDPNSPNAPADKIARSANMLIGGSANLSFAGAGNLYVAGNWNNTVGPSGFTAGTSTVTLMGSTGAGCTQTITTAGSNETFYNLVINNICNRDGAGLGDNVTLNSPVNVTGVLTLTDGIVKTSATNILTVTNPAVTAIAGGGAASYINGPIARLTNSTGTYIFPTGNPDGATLYGVYRPATIIPGSGSANSYTGAYLPTAAPEVNNQQLGTTGILTTEYWDIKPSGACTGTAVIGLPYVYPASASHWTAGMAPCSSCNVAIARPAPTAWYFTDFNNFVGTGFNGSIPEDRFYSNSGMIYTKPIDCNGFQTPHFTFGFNFATVLPVGLVSFEGKFLNNNDARLVWEVANSNEIRRFMLEHSSDGNRFSLVSDIPAGSVNTYQYDHKSLSPGLHYYRLLLTDKRGEKTYSKTLLLVNGKQVTVIRNIVPNPVTQSGYVNLLSAGRQQARIVIYDLAGRLIGERRYDLTEGENRLEVAAGKLAQGIYNLQVITGDGVSKNLRMIKE